MADRGFVYRVVSVGVNRSEGQKPLKFAESDARQVFNTFTGALGPASGNDSMLLLGANAATWDLALALEYMRFDPPEWKGLRGDFPMLISQAETPLGAGLVYVDLLKTGLRADVTVNVYGRRGLPTEIRCHLVDANNQHIDSATFPIRPTRNDAQFNHQFTFQRNVLPAAHRRVLDSGNVIALTWHIHLVEPIHNRLISQNNSSLVYSAR